ncbi:MAG: HlyC/CorC family transporter [Gammaproteobacteria bacterium]|nr:HlyC/CorC family transporter [Gammaproteobacteria bacterium]
MFVILLLLSGFFSSSETAMFSLNTIHIEQMRRSGNPRLELIERMLSEPRRLIVTILIGNEFVNVAASVISAAMVIELFGNENKWLNLIIMVPILLLFGEITPKTLAIRNNIAFATVESRPINFFAQLITPLRWLIRMISDFFTTLIVGRERSSANIITSDMVRTLAHDAVGKGALDRHEARFIDKIFELGDKKLSDLITPRAEITFLPEEISLNEVLTVLKETRQSRYPVYRKHRDEIIGILHARDLINADFSRLESNNSSLLKLLRTPYFVPESKPALELFDNFREQHRSFALTVDEYGGVTGLITMEDILECIFGDIPSPSDSQEQYLTQEISEGRYITHGLMPLEEFNHSFASNLEDEEMSTIGGVVLHNFGELPEEGATTRIHNFTFRVTRVEKNRIEELEVIVGDPDSETKEEANHPAEERTLPETDGDHPPETNQKV